MSTPTTPAQIVRCVRADYGTTPEDLRSGARYCETIGRSYARNPWASPGDAEAYRAAALALYEQANEAEAWLKLKKWMEVEA